MEKFTRSYEIDYQSLYTDFTVTFPRLMLYIQETSIRQVNATRFPMSWYLEHSKGWFVSEWCVRMESYPRLDTTISVSAYAIDINGVAGDRGTEIFTDTGAPVLTACSTWVYLDVEKQKLARPKQEIVDDYLPFFPAPMDKELGFIRVGREGCPYVLASQREFTATRRDIDINNHVNNVKYIEWALDDIPEAVYAAARPRSVRVLYKKQCRIGDRVLAEFYSNPENPYQVATIFKNADDGKSVLSEIYTQWRAYNQDGFL